jgi:hypothetical protein
MGNFNEPIYDDHFKEEKRPGFLTFLCVLTFIGSGMSFLTNLFLPFLAPIMVEALNNSSFASIPGIVDMYEQVLVTPIWQFYLLAFFCATALLGAVYMIKMKKIGFHIYTVSQLAQLCIGQFIIGEYFKPNAFGLILTALFIGLYAIFYKKFTNLDEEKIDSNE